MAHPDRPGAVLSWESLAESAHALENSTAGNVLETHLTYHTEGEAWGYGGYLAAVSVDPDTGVAADAARLAAAARRRALFVRVLVGATAVSREGPVAASARGDAGGL